MKKVFLVIFFISLALCSCKKNKVSDVYKDFTNEVSKCSSYELKGQLEVKKKEGANKFNMEVIYKEPNLYRVTYQSENTNSRQVILKNNDGVYVISPELNKEFKFESEWPLNSSHIYILNRVVMDLTSDDNVSKEVKDNYYVFSSKINYKNKSDLDRQEVYLKKQNKELDKIVYKSNDKVVMEFNVSSLVFDKTLSNSDFNLDSIMNSETSLIGEGEIQDISNVEFDNIFNLESNKDSKNSISVISYNGEKDYKIIYYNVEKPKVATISRIYDDFVTLDDSIGLVSKSCLTFFYGNKEFKIISDKLSLDEMILIANSLHK